MKIFDILTKILELNQSIVFLYYKILKKLSLLISKTFNREFNRKI